MIFPVFMYGCESWTIRKAEHWKTDDFELWCWKRRQWHPTPVLLPGNSHGWRSLLGFSPWGRWIGHDWATSISFLLSCIGEGNGNPLQCSCLENPRDGGAWWAAVYGVTQSWTWLKRLSSSSSSSIRDVIRYLSFSDWLTSLSVTMSRSFHVAAKHIISFFSMAE